MSIQLEDLHKIYDKTPAVRGVSVTIEDGEFFVLLGPSGCGKTTTLRMIAGLETPSAGRVHIHGRDVTDLEPRRRDIAMAFQDYGLYPHLSVAGNIEFPLKVRGVKKAERRRHASEVAERMGIVSLLGRRPAQLSGGERQRVSLARALVRNPRVFLMDEPLSNLDAKLRVVMRAEIKRLVSDLGITTVYVTHDQTEAMAMASRIGVMNHGRMVQLGEPLEIYDRPATRFVASFIGSPPMNLFEGTIEAGGAIAVEPAFLRRALRPDHVVGALGTATIGDQVIVGVRPEHIEIGSNTEPALSRAEVELVEPLGQDTYVYLRSGATSLIAVTKRTKVRVGETVGLHVSDEHVHLISPAGYPPAAT